MRLHMLQIKSWALLALLGIETTGFAQIQFAVHPGQPIEVPGLQSMDHGDIDGDGDQDVILTRSGSMGLYTNDGQGNFTLHLDDFGEFFNSDVSFCDVDGDADLDVLIAGDGGYNFGREVRLFTNDGLGNFTQSSADFLGVNFCQIEGADVDQDGDTDVLIYGSEAFGLTLNLYVNDGTGAFTSVPVSINPGPFVLGDLDNDGDLDVVCAEEYGPCRAYLNDGAGGFSSFGSAYATSSNAHVDLGDIDGDGDLDLVLFGIDEGGLDSFLEVYANDGAGNFTAQPTALPGAWRGQSAFADLDDDGDLDLAMAAVGIPGETVVTAVFENDGNGSFSEVPDLPFVENADGELALFDLDGDGDCDAMIGGWTTSAMYLNQHVVSVGEFDPCSLEIVPNPFVDEVDVRVGAEQEFTLTIVDVMGREMWAPQRMLGHQQLRLGGLPVGVYVVVLEAESWTVVERLVKR